MKIEITTGHTNKSFKDNDLFIQEKVKTGFNHNLNYELLKQFDFVPQLIKNSNTELIWKFIEGQVPKPNSQNLKQIALNLKELHNSKLNFPKSNHQARVEKYLEILKQKNINLAIVENLKPFVFELLKNNQNKWPLHNDLWLNNMILDSKDKLWIIDWEYSTMGDVNFELAYFIEASALDDVHTQYFLTIYQDYDYLKVLKNRIFVNYLVILWVNAQDVLHFPYEPFIEKINSLLEILKEYENR
ncbi:phosphotransferase family protein [Mycoplasmopsis iners]|uniref:phosphotransferase family protein n=1 Tax=Mycoplasmopsis iners TaxID=76630 RepID=UPI000494FAD6|nr:phosphotransferase [Mycoplasmopsis iners]